MIVYPVIVAFRSLNWLPIAVESYLSQFPQDRLLVVDNNPRLGETGWSPAARRESRWLDSYPRVDVIRQSSSYLGAPVTRTHGSGMDLALAWCRSRGADVMLHIEPDCLITGRAWRDNLLRAIERGAWMAGAHRKAWGPIHPTPSVWLVREARTSFSGQSRKNSPVNLRFKELVNLEILRAAAEPDGVWDWARENWDTADKAWFEASIHEKAALVEAPDFRHFWFGATANCLPLEELVVRFPELAAWLTRPKTDGGRPLVEDCYFRLNVRRTPDFEIACCNLLQQLSGVSDAGLCDVRRDVCQACRELPEPSVSNINPVIASQLYTLGELIFRRNGVDGCDVQSASHLRSFAQDHLDLRLPGEGPSPAPRRSDRACQHFGQEVGFRILATASGHDRQLVFECRHPDHVETTVAECQRCCDWTEELLTNLWPIERLVPAPDQRLGPPVRHWAVGVMTAPRTKPTLHACLDSLFRAGWEMPRLFVDSAVTVPERFSDLPVTFRETKLGPFPNYYLALVELIMREPDADAFMLVEDDVIFDDRHNLRRYLEEILWPAHPIGAVSLYCSKAYTRPLAGWYEFDGLWVWGALAFVFSRESAERFATDPAIFEHRRNQTEGLINVDIQIGHWAHEQRLPIYFPTPSLVQHVGDSSSVWVDSSARALGDRRADRFTGDIGQIPSV